MMQTKRNRFQLIENAMRSRNYIPQSDIKWAVEYICLQESNQAAEVLQFPTLQAEIAFNFGNRFALSNSSNEVFWYPEYGAINGINTCPVKKYWEAGLISLSVKFKPWGLFQLFGWDARLFSKKVVAAPLYFQNSSFKPLKNYFLNEQKIERKVFALEEFLLKSARVQTVPKDIFSFVDDIEDEESIKVYLKRKRIAHTTFNRQFKKVMGVGIKKFLSIKRIQNTMRDIQKNDLKSLTEIAYHHGFYDQAHFIRSFSTFTGMTPLQFKKRMFP